MGNPFLGAGEQPAGWTPPSVFYPVPSAVNHVVFQDPSSGQPDTSRLIDPYAKQFVFGANGDPLGMTTAEQLVVIAWGTIQLQNAVPTFSSGWQNRVRSLYTSAVASYVAQKIISIVDFTIVRFGRNGLKVTIKWKDLTTGIEQVFVPSPG